MKKIIYCVLLLSLILTGCGIKDKNRVQENKIENPLKITDYLLPPENSEPRTEKITHVVIHFISNAGKTPKNPYDIKEVYSLFKEYGVSSHYVIGRGGEIYRTVPEENIAYHAGKGSLPGFPEYENKLNQYSIGIELLAIGTESEMQSILPKDDAKAITPSLRGYTEEQYMALNSLLENIIKRTPSIERDRKHIIGHDEYASGRKTDPGKLFDWSKIGF